MEILTVKEAIWFLSLIVLMLYFIIGGREEGRKDKET